jgi:endonuclease YncB( thermonuclease family)
VRRGRGNKKAALRFNLSTTEKARPSWLSLLMLCAGTGLICGVLLLAYQRKQVSAVPAFVMPSTITVSKVSEPLSHQLVSYSVRFEPCGRVRSTCVVDGDTLWLNGEKIRIADIDTPEISSPKCQREYKLGILAKQRLVVLLNEGEFSLTTSRWGDEDRYGRKLRLLFRNSESIGNRLVQEGLAHRWNGHKISWCADAERLR